MHILCACSSRALVNILRESPKITQHDRSLFLMDFLKDKTMHFLMERHRYRAEVLKTVEDAAVMNSIDEL